MIDVAAALHPEHEFQVGDLRFLWFDGEFDAVWCCAVLHHLESQDLSLALGAIRRSLHLGGIAFISVKASLEDGDEEHEQAPDEARRFVRVRPEEFLRSLSAEGFLVIESYVRRGGGDTWLCIFARSVDRLPGGGDDKK
jgi:SAM-dependent methyltransferase